MKIFISYSVDDADLVWRVARQLQLQAETVYWWQGSKEPGKEVWPQILGWIDQADLVLAVLTDSAVARAMAIGNEIGHAKAKGKLIIPLVAPNVSSTELGCLCGVTYQRIDRKNPGPALEAVTRQIRAMKQQAAEKLQLVLVVGGIIAVLWLLSQK